MEKIDVFDKYLQNQMNLEEKKAFEGTLRNDLETNETFRRYKLAVELLKFDNLKKEISTVHKEFNKPQAKVIKFPSMRIAAAIFIGFLCFGGFWISQNNGRDLLENNTLNYIQPMNRGDVEERKQAELYYINAQFDELILLYKSSEKPAEKLTFLTAMAYFKQKNYQESLKLIENLQNTNPNSTFNNELDYYKGQNLVGLNRINEALKGFEKIDKTNPYSEALSWSYLLKLKILALKN